MDSGILLVSNQGRLAVGIMVGAQNKGANHMVRQKAKDLRSRFTLYNSLLLRKLIKVLQILYSSLLRLTPTMI